MLPLQTAQQILPPEAASDPYGTDAIMALHTHTVDVYAGYDKMLEKAEPEFVATAEAFAALHDRQAEQIVADLDVSFMGLVNKAVVADADVITKIRNGEDHLLTAFDDVLGQNIDPETDRELREMQDKLVALLDRARELCFGNHWRRAGSFFCETRLRT